MGSQEGEEKRGGRPLEEGARGNRAIGERAILEARENASSTGQGQGRDSEAEHPYYAPFCYKTHSLHMSDAPVSSTMGIGLQGNKKRVRRVCGKCKREAVRKFDFVAHRRRAELRVSRFC